MFMRACADRERYLYRCAQRGSDSVECAAWYEFDRRSSRPTANCQEHDDKQDWGRDVGRSSSAAGTGLHPFQDACD